jgi:hypothetical protein
MLLEVVILFISEFSLQGNPLYLSSSFLYLNTGTRNIVSKNIHIDQQILTLRSITPAGEYSRDP